MLVSHKGTDYGNCLELEDGGHLQIFIKATRGEGLKVIYSEGLSPAESEKKHFRGWICRGILESAEVHCVCPCPPQ